MGGNPFTMAGRMTAATANAMESAAANPNGMMGGIFGMGMGMNMAGGNAPGGFGAAQGFYQQGVQQQQQQAAQSSDASNWICSCGAANNGKFCTNCGSPRPTGAPLMKCNKCAWVPDDPTHPPKFCPECGDASDDNDKQ